MGEGRRHPFAGLPLFGALTTGKRESLFRSTKVMVTAVAINARVDVLTSVAALVGADAEGVVVA
eukprot:16428194-Heterocapsa_arctica.AAC.1